MKNCIAFGSGTAYLRLSETFNLNKISIIGIIDNDPKKWGTELKGKLIDSPDNLIKYKWDYILICSSFYEKISKQLVELGVLSSEIINYYELVTVCLLGRNYVANNHLIFENGYREGLEVGGAHNLLALKDSRIRIKQVDRVQHSDTTGYYRGRSVVKVDIIDNGETLEKVEDESQDFVISCHMLEHCRNPIGTLRNFFRVIRKGGIIFLAIPDKRFTVDKDRNLTDFEHLVADDEEPSWERDVTHLEMPKNEDKELEEKLKEGLDMYYHVWDANTFFDFIYNLKQYLEHCFEVEQCGRMDSGNESNECIIVLRKIK